MGPMRIDRIVVGKRTAANYTELAKGELTEGTTTEHDLNPVVARACRRPVRSPQIGSRPGYEAMAPDRDKPASRSSSDPSAPPEPRHYQDAQMQEFQE